MRCHWRYLRKLVENTSGGLDRIVLIRSNERVRLLLWCLMYIFLTVFMIDLCLRSVKAYSAFPTTTSIDLRERLSVPSIALCSINPFKRDKLCVEPYASLCDPRTNFADAFAELAAAPANVSDEFVDHYTQALYKLEDLVLSCWLLGKPCASYGGEFFTPVIIEVQRYGRCFCVFCEKHRKYAEALERRTQFPMNGLVLQLSSKTDDYMPQTTAVGYLVLFYTYRKSAMVTRDSVHVGLDESTYMGLETAEVKLLPAPYPSRCGSAWPEEYESVEGIAEEQYSYSSCMRICFSQQLIEECKCLRTMQFDDLTEFDHVCRRSLGEMKCRVKALGSPKRYRVNCKCPAECSMNSYFVRTSRAGYPKRLSKAAENGTTVSLWVPPVPRLMNFDLNNHECSWLPACHLSRTLGDNSHP